MRSLFLVISSLIGASAFAYPGVGSFSNYNVVDFIGDSYSLRDEVVEFKHDDGFVRLLQTSAKENGWMWHPSEAVFQRPFDILGNCEKYGRIETITVPAGVFETCAVDFKSYSYLVTTWYGNGPFNGIIKKVKTTYDDQSRKEEVLKEFANF